MKCVCCGSKEADRDLCEETMNILKAYSTKKLYDMSDHHIISFATR